MADAPTRSALDGGRSPPAGSAAGGRRGSIGSSRGVWIAPRSLTIGALVASIGIGALVLFLWMVPIAAQRETRAACASLGPEMPNNAVCAGKNCQLPALAPDFTAIDNNGNPVKLSDFRGKVVLLNFWASWCGVCTTEKPHIRGVTDDLGGDDFKVIALASDHTWSEALIGLIDSLAPTAAVADARAVTGDDDAAVAAYVRVLRTHPQEERVGEVLSVISAAHGDKFAQRVFDATKAAGEEVSITDALWAYKRALPAGSVPFNVYLDPPEGDGNIGKIAASWGINKLPESALIDRAGRIRMYITNKRDWDSPVAETCLRSVIDND